jgi:hypothetical protein
VIRINSKGGRIGQLWWINSDTRLWTWRGCKITRHWGNCGIGQPDILDDSLMINVPACREAMEAFIERHRE